VPAATAWFSLIVSLPPCRKPALANGSCR